MDLNGFAKDAYYIHQVQWIKDRPLVYLAPHWNWAGKEGTDIRVMVMANVERVKLVLNGRELGEQKVDNYRMNYFNVKYEQGKLEAIGFNGDKEVARASVETTGKAVALELIPDRKSLVGDGHDAMPITVRALDAKGRAVPIDNSEVTFDISGAGKSIGHGNGNPNSHEDEKGKTRKLFNGLAQLIVQSNFPEARGASKSEVKITASAAGLKTAKLSIPVKTVSTIPFVAEAVAPLSYLTNWRVSPASAERPNPTQILADNDMNTWGWGQPPMMNIPADVKDGKYRLYRTSFTPRKNLANGAGRIHFYGITGKAEIWLNGELIGKKDNHAPGELNLVLPAGEGLRQLNVIVEGEGDKKAGVNGNVVIEPKK
jgi:beta-galactosidase